MESIRAWVEDSSFGAGLGVRLVDIDADRVVVRLPFINANSNPGGALHGGCAASLGVIGGLALAQSVLGADMVPFHTAAVQVNYLAAAVNEDVRASTRLLRRGKELCFAETSVETDEGKAIAQISCVVRGRAGRVPPALVRTGSDAGGTDPGRMGPQVAAMPFSAGRGFKVDHMTQSYARIRMPLGDANADVSGSFHEGALLALLDTTGAMAAWADTGPGPYKASTASIQAQIICAPTTSEVVAYGRVTQRDNELFWSSVEIADTATALVCARGTVIYRIVT